jgi:hypothetical protein
LRDGLKIDAQCVLFGLALLSTITYLRTR